MPALVNYRGDDDFYSGHSICSRDSGVVCSIRPHSDIYRPSRKRMRILSPYLVKGSLHEYYKPSIDKLPDECLFEIFTRLPGGQERSVAACVSKRWLTILSSIRTSEIFAFKTHNERSGKNSEDKESSESDGYLTRCVEGKKATDIRLLSIAVGTSNRGGLGKLSVRGSDSSYGVSNLGLTAIARGCPSLRTLSLWNMARVNDQGLVEVARECHLLEKLDLCQCSSISDKGLMAIAEGCSNLTSIMIESCSNIGNESLQAIAKYCPKLTSIAIKDCPLVGDQGIASVLTMRSSVLAKVKLHSLNITDCSVAVIGHYGNAITNLSLGGLQYVSQKGLWVMGNAKGLKMLSTLTVNACNGMTDLSLEAVGSGCLNMKHVSLRKCCFVSDDGLAAFVKATSSLESFQLEECNRITQNGLLNAISCSNPKLKSVSLIRCMGIKDTSRVCRILSPCESIRSLSIRGCPGFGSSSLAMVGKLCPQLNHLDLSGLSGITDAGILPFFEFCQAGLVKVDLSGCVNLTDEVVLALVRLHGETLERLNLDGCPKVTDASLSALAISCPSLKDLDVSKCSVTDSGIVSLSCGLQNLQILSFSGCSMISSKSVPAIEKLGSTLLGLNLQNCVSISNSAVESLMGRLWKCDILY